MTLDLVCIGGRFERSFEVSKYGSFVVEAGSIDTFVRLGGEEVAGSSSSESLSLVDAGVNSSSSACGIRVILMNAVGLFE